MPSTHVYLRQHDYDNLVQFKDNDQFISWFKSFEDSNNQLISDLKMICGCVCKLNSKEGRKGESVKIIYTPAANVIKSKSDNPGQVT